MTTVAELVIQEAMARGNHYIFGIPGGGPGLTMISAASRAGCHFVLVNNEATGAMAASAYGQFVGTPGVCFSIQGTGGGNLVGGIVACYLERGPVLAITDRYPDELLGRVHIQDAHLARVLAPIVKGSMTLQLASARRTLHSAFELAWAERPGPVHLDFPADVADVPISETESVIKPAIPQASISGEVVAAAKALGDAKRVVVIVGTDALRARVGKEIRHLVEKNRAVALTTWRARGLFPEDHPRYGTMFYGNFVPETGEMDYLTQADLVVLAGVDPVEISQPWPGDMPILQVHLSPEISEACPSASLKLYGPLRRVLGALAELQVNPAGFSEEQIRTTRQNALVRFAPSTDDRLPAQEAMLRMRKLFPRQGILVQETGIYNVLNEHIWTVYEPGTYVSTGGSRTMGAAIPWAIGTALARPNQPVLAFSGDGGFLMRLQELEVVARLSLKIIFVVFNDGQLGTIQARRVARGLEASGLNFAPVDFVAIARGFGLHAAVVGRLDRLQAALEQALTADRASVIELKLDPAFYTSLFSCMLGTGHPIKEINPMKGIQGEDH